MARKLAREMFDPTVRVHGSGRWTRGDDGLWRVDEFQISQFEVLEEDALSEVINEIRRTPSAWKREDDSETELDSIRTGEPHKP
jgi:hypothetical protein